MSAKVKFRNIFTLLKWNQIYNWILFAIFRIVFDRKCIFTVCKIYYASGKASYWVYGCVCARGIYAICLIECYWHNVDGKTVKGNLFRSFIYYGRKSATESAMRVSKPTLETWSLSDESERFLLNYLSSWLSCWLTLKIWLLETKESGRL